MNADVEPKDPVTRKFCALSADGMELHGRQWSSSKPVGVIAWVHGYAEHVARYAHFGQWLAAQGWALAVVDLRGHGESPGQRGHVTHFKEYFQDVTALIEYCRHTWPDTPLVLGAHSMGALVALRYLQENTQTPELTALVTTGAYLRLSTPLPAWKHWAGKLLAHIYPRFSLPTDISPQWLTHDEVIYREYANHPLVFKTGTAGWYRTTARNQEMVLAQAANITLPSMMLHGQEDPLASPRQAKVMFDALGSRNKYWKDYPGFFHEILNELGREQVYLDILKWLQENALRPRPPTSWTNV